MVASSVGCREFREATHRCRVASLDLFRIIFRSNGDTENNLRISFRRVAEAVENLESRVTSSDTFDERVRIIRKLSSSTMLVSRRSVTVIFHVHFPTPDCSPFDDFLPRNDFLLLRAPSREHYALAFQVLRPHLRRIRSNQLAVDITEFSLVLALR